MSSEPTRVFISYSHDSAEHKRAVATLANRLREDGVDCRIDQFERSPAEGWPRWCENQIEESKFVLVVCTETYLRRFRAKEEPGKGKGVTFEGYIITQEIYDSQGKNEKFVPVLFSAADRQQIPSLLRGATNYDFSNPDEYDEFYWTAILGQPAVPPSKIGTTTRNRPTAIVSPTPLPKLEPKDDFAPRPSSSTPVPSPFFTGREAVLKEVQKKLKQGKNVALSGMRGVGKTQIAKQFAHSHRKDYSRLFWVRAEKHETFVADFASIAQLLDLPQKHEKDQSIIVAAVKSWLETNRGWLLILDNADDVSLAQQFVPAAHEGRVLLTSTASSFGGWAEKVPVEQMDPEEAALLLLRRAAVIGKEAQWKQAKEADRKLALALAKKLGWLPLALDQAGAYIEETPSNLAEYTQFYENEGKRLRELRGGLNSEHPSVEVTFSLAFQELSKRDPLAADLVRLCAFLAPDAIPEETFTKGASALGEGFARRAKNSLDFVNTIKEASKFSLIRRDASDRSLSIHRLVQDVLKDEMNAEQHRAWAERTVRAVDATFPSPEFSNWPDCERLLPHSKACAGLIEDFSFEFAEAARLLHQTASYMDDRAQYGEAEQLFKRALSIREKALGPDHPEVATSLNNLAVLYNNQERDSEAEPLYRRALAIYEKALGPDHADVATSHNNLALLYKKQGNYAAAEPLYQRALAIYEKALGPDHPGTATGLNNLAQLYSAQGRYSEAEPLSQRALAIREKALGPEHPLVAISLNNLAALYDDQGRYGEAEQLYRSALTISEKALGPSHPTVATVLENYAALLRKTGRESEARAMEAGAKAIREKMENQAKQ